MSKNEVWLDKTELWPKFCLLRKSLTKHMEHSQEIQQYWIGLWYLLLHVFWLLLWKFNIWKGKWALGSISTKIWHVYKNVQFIKILSLESLSNSRVNSHINFVILRKKFCFSCDESITYFKFLKYYYQNYVRVLLNFCTPNDDLSFVEKDFTSI